MNKILLKNSIIYGSLCIIMLFMSGCGFELRKKQSFPSQLNDIYYQADQPYDNVTVELKQELKAATITFAENINQAKIILHLSTPAFTHSNTSTGPSTQARVYNMSMSVVLSITDPKGKLLFAPQTVTATRDLTLQPNEIFDVSTQVDAVKNSMERDLITRIFNILTSKKTFDSLKEVKL